MDQPSDAPKAAARSGRTGMLLGGLAALVFLIGGIVFAEYRMGWLDNPETSKLKGQMPHLEKGSVGGNPRPRGNSGAGARRTGGGEPKAEETITE